MLNASKFVALGTTKAVCFANCATHKYVKIILSSLFREMTIKIADPKDLLLNMVRMNVNGNAGELKLRIKVRLSTVSIAKH